ncbi:MAG: GlsB/YeaQ/YmgE family stress response membrane protein [Candidatus Krumholzibacteriota bacterium]|nr:GlsB/YeaQ/YmgE family stress response membrane protein [Candidatus Krumholzibacteriota bacterium]
MNIIWFLLIGGVAGWLAGLIMKGKGFGILVNIIVGVIGGIIGGWLFGVLGIGGESLIWTLVTALVGAVILLFIVSLFKKKGVAE